MKYLGDLWRGRLGLAKTYWAWGVAGSFAWVAALSLLRKDEASAAPMALLLAFLVYQAVVLVGVWNAARRYTGPAMWRRSAYMLTVMGAAVWAALVWAMATAA